MSKLSLDALKERANSVASEELLNSISGGTANDCHCTCDNKHVEHLCPTGPGRPE